MSSYSLQEIEAVKGKYKFYKLIKDGICEFDNFENEARRNYNSEMNSILHRMNLVSEGNKLPVTQFRILKGNLKNIHECEIKSKNLRVYYFVDKVSGNIVVTGGYKKKQTKDIAHFRKVITNFIKNIR